MSGRHNLGKYRLLAELGHGGMADVYLALVEGPAGSGFAKLAVVKRLRPNLAEDSEFITMLMDEARITARLNHPNVVQMLEVGVVEEEYFLAMEYLDGQPLHRIERRAARSGAPLSRRVQIAILIDVLAGLHHAHELADYDGGALDIVHRDVTPHNVFVTYDGLVKVMDFGIAKAAGRAHETQHGIVKGKTRYMSPEQAMGRALDRRADLFSVGILLWQAATNQRFWGEAEELEIVQSLIAGDYEASPAAIAADVDPELDRICRRALAASADDRFATAEELRRELERYLGAEALAARRELTALVNEQFAKERSEIRAVIERAGKETARARGIVPVSRGSTSTSSTSFPVPAVASTLPPPSLASPSSAPPPSVQVASARPRPGGGSFIIASIAAAVVAMGALGLSLRATSAPPSAHPSVVATDFVRLADGHRPRAEARAEPPATVLVPVWTAPPPPRATAASPASAIPVVAAVAPPAPASSLPPPAVGVRGPRGQGRLNVDTADPWQGARAQ